MYQSRLHATNGVISIAVDALSGEVLEFTRESTWDNAAKNHVRKTWSLFDGIAHTAAGDRRLHPPRYLDTQADKSLLPEVRVDQRPDSARVTITFPKLMIAEETVDMSAQIVIDLPQNESRSLWNMHFENHAGIEIGKINFPAVDGLWLGETWEDDMLALPHFAGKKILNPTRAFSQEPQNITWKWQEYLYGYQLNESCGKPDDRGAYVRYLPYSGACSMLWMDLYDPTENTGIYLTCRTSGTHMMGLRAETFGETYPGVGLAVTHEMSLENGEWDSEECVLAFHEGDWHWGADDYRTWFESIHPAVPQTHRPAWFMESAGLMAHYDFQYQGGGVVHRYTDIPHLFELAQGMGFNHLLLSGWNKDGFDFGFPHYEVNPNLGTEQELKDALAEVKAKGGHVAFYINSRIVNTGFEDQQERLQKFAVKNRDGSRFEEKYGADDVSFASMCINTEWRKFLLKTVNYLTHEIGADSMYLDQLAMACSVKCYEESHDHHSDRTAWNGGYQKLIEEMIADYDRQGMALIYEGNNDVFGPMSSAQLITTMFAPKESRLPEMYRYTFPQQVLTDMMNPRRNSGMRPEHVARQSTASLYRAFVCGMYFWCYDLEWDNTWRRDPEQYVRLKNIVDLRVRWLKTCGMGTFRDTVGIVQAPEEFMIKRFDLEDGVLIAAAAENGVLSGDVTIDWDRPKVSAEMMVYGKPGTIRLPVRMENGKATFWLPKEEAAVIILK